VSDRFILIAEIQGELEALKAKVALLADPAPATAPPPPLAPAPSPDPALHPGFGDEGAFYDWLRDDDMLGPKISGPEFTGCDSITRACAAAKWPLAFTAYALATAYLETNHQMIPVREAYWLSDSAAAAYFRRMYDIEGSRPAKARELGNLSPGDGARYCGRGYPQLTGKKNYLKAGTALGLDLISRPDLALQPSVAAQIMVRGMAEGWFTGKKLADYLPASGEATKAKFLPARRIINGTDRADDVAGFAVGFQNALLAGKWKF
jgi:putative chitinase